MSWWVTVFLGAGLTLLLSARAADAYSLRTAAGAGQRATAPPCPSAWHLVPSPALGPSQLSGIAVVSTDDAWAVGARGLGNGSMPLAEHWDGQRWRVVSLPAVGHAPPSVDLNAPGAGLSAVAAASATDVWAVGQRGPSEPGTPTVVMHWDGHRWKLVSSPNPGPGGMLSAVAALSAHEVWAVGTIGRRRTLAERWDGRVWRIVPTPVLQGEDVGLTGVVALAADAVWAVGTRGSARTGSRRGLVERWDGQSWHVVPSPQPGGVDDALSAVSASGSADVWAVGLAEGTDYETRPLVERWNGRAWQAMPVPSLPATQGAGGLTAVAAAEAYDIWVAAGGALDHWNGRRWTAMTVHTSNYRGGLDYAAASTPAIAALAPVGRSAAWAVGQVIENTEERYSVLIAHYGPTQCAAGRQ